MSEAKQRTLNLTVSASTQTLPLDGRVLTPEMTAEALNTFRGPQGPKGADGTMSFDNLTAEQIEMLRGPKGDRGEDGKDAPQDAYTPSNPPPYPVKSVNGKTGAVSLSASDVGALPSDGKAVDADKLNGKSADAYALKTDIPDAYTLPTATADKLGGVKSSEAVTVNADGTMTVNQLDSKVDKEDGKGLSTNDFTDEYVSRLEALENVEGPSVYAHRTTFRGKYLGASLTDAQKTTIQNGTFDDIFLGDYWTIDGVNYRVADFDYFYRCGDEDFTNHHLVIVPDNCLYSAQMNSSNVTTGGYTGSAMYTSNLATAKSKITAAFGSAVLTHKDYLTNAVTNGYPSGGAWFSSTVELMNEVMVYGSAFFTPRGNGSSVYNLYTIGKMQFALFQAVPNFINIREAYWLRDVGSSTFFARCNSNGNADRTDASTSHGVRPYFCIG